MVALTCSAPAVDLSTTATKFATCMAATSKSKAAVPLSISIPSPAPAANSNATAETSSLPLPSVSLETARLVKAAEEACAEAAALRMELGRVRATQATHVAENTRLAYESGVAQVAAEFAPWMEQARGQWKLERDTPEWKQKQPKWLTPRAQPWLADEGEDARMGSGSALPKPAPPRAMPPKLLPAALAEPMTDAQKTEALAPKGKAEAPGADEPPRPPKAKAKAETSAAEAPKVELPIASGPQGLHRIRTRKPNGPTPLPAACASPKLSPRHTSPKRGRLAPATPNRAKFALPEIPPFKRQPPKRAHTVHV